MQSDDLEVGFGGALRRFGIVLGYFAFILHSLHHFSIIFPYDKGSLHYLYFTPDYFYFFMYLCWSRILRTSKAGLMWPQFLAVISGYFSEIYKNYRTTKKSNDYGNKVFYEMEAIADTLSNGDRSKFVDLLKKLVKSTSLRYAKED
jgi:hypothetical protein